MKIIHITAYRNGGAGIATNRIHNKILSLGYDSDIYYLEDFSKNIFHYYLNKVYKKIINFIYKKSNFLKDQYIFINNSELKINGINPSFIKKIKHADIIFVHWVSDHLNTYDLYNLYKNINARIIFIMMDLAHITGGCHYTLGCNNYKSGCINCPALDYNNKKLAYNQQLVKSINIAKFKGEILSFSDNDLLSARNSSIPFYKYWRLDIPFKKPVISKKTSNTFNILPSAYSFYNTRKGIDNFKQVLYILDNKLTAKESINIFNINYPDYFKKDFKHINFISFNFFTEHNKLIDLYNDTSLLVFTSFADSAPQMVVESIISNTKVFTYDVGNMKELINKKNGLIISNHDPHIMADAILEFYRECKDNLIQIDEEISDSVKRYYDDENFKIQFSKILNG